MMRSVLALMLTPTVVMAGDVTITDATVPLAPPGVTTHAAYLKLVNTGEAPLHLIGVAANGYQSASIHRTEVKDDIATMSPVDQVEIAPGQPLVFERGGLHVMLMKPEAALEPGGTVDLTLKFANGETIPISARVVRITGGAHGHGS